MSAAITPLSLFAEAEKHDGFYFNFLLGGGYDESTLKYSDSTDAKYSGMAYMFKIKLGGAPVENFIIYGLAGFYNLENPKLTIGSESETFNNIYVTHNEFGGGFCYYIMPDNIFISADLTATQLGIGNTKAESDDEELKTSDTGWDLTLSFGKEWWVSENWGVGAAIVATFGSVPAGWEIAGEDNENDKIIHKYLGVAFTATYN
jgi:hypothetical protein